MKRRLLQDDEVFSHPKYHYIWGLEQMNKAPQSFVREALLADKCFNYSG